MAKRIGFGNYQYEVVEHWPRVEIRGAVADVCVDARGRVYAGVRNPRDDGSVSNILGGVGHVVVGVRRARRRASLSPAVSTAPGWTPTAPSIPPKPAATIASRSSCASDLRCPADGGLAQWYPAGGDIFLARGTMVE
jgi:hypothetical protein